MIIFNLFITLLVGIYASSALASSSQLNTISEIVYVESPTDTDGDGLADRIYVKVNRPRVAGKFSTILHMSPYALGGNSVGFHDVDSERLPQDVFFITDLNFLNFNFNENQVEVLKPLLEQKLFYFWEPISSPLTSVYASLEAHSLGTGFSTGCPTVGDISEALAGKAVIDWLNGSARAYYENGREAFATWANGRVGMTGVSYDGTLPVMVAATGVKGLRAIVPVAAISNWYNYYRANGLVVGPGGYIGEDADILGQFIVRPGYCRENMDLINKTMGRETGDYTEFWQNRDYLPMAKNFKAATFIIHGQSDWNVKQKQAIDLWKALEGVVPRRIFLHRGGHGSTRDYNVPQKIQAWFDFYLNEVESGELDGPIVEVELSSGSLQRQNSWPSEQTQPFRFFFSEGKLNSNPPNESSFIEITDCGRTKKIEELSRTPDEFMPGRIVFRTPILESEILLSGSPEINLKLSVLNRKAANLSVALVEYLAGGRTKIVTRGWADPQNYRDLRVGEKLNPEQSYLVRFDLEPKQYLFSKGSQIGVVIASTDFDFTLRPRDGTKLKFYFDDQSQILLHLSKRP